MTRITDWNGGLGNLCMEDNTNSHCVVASFIPFHFVRPQKTLR